MLGAGDVSFCTEGFDVVALEGLDARGTARFVWGRSLA